MCGRNSTSDVLKNIPQADGARNERLLNAMTLVVIGELLKTINFQRFGMSRIGTIPKMSSMAKIRRR